MDLILELKEKLSERILDSLSGFLGESQENIQSAFNLAIPAFLDVIVKKSNSTDEVLKLKNVLNDGGHTGQILNDLDSLFTNVDKVQLLITIGSNIVNHFVPEKSLQISSIIADFAKIKKTSATSVLSLASPLVLGALGNSIANSSDPLVNLKKVLIEQKSYINTTLPPVLANQITVAEEKKASTTKPTKTNSKSDNKNQSKVIDTDSKEKGSKIYIWLSWILLIGLLIGSLLYWKFFKNGDLSFKKDEVVETLPKETFDPAELLTPHEDSIEVNDFLKEPESVTNRKDSIKKDVAQSQTKDWDDESIKKAEEPKKTLKVETAKPKTVVTSEPKNTSKSNNSVNKEKTSDVKSTDSESSISQKTLSFNGDWVNYSSLSFAKNSAEIKSPKAIEGILTFLKKNPNAKIRIAGYSSDSKTLAEDRAYAVRDALIEKGISESRLLLSEIPLNGKGSVAIKAIK